MAQADKPTVAYLAPSLNISYWQWVGYGVKEKAESLGMNYVQYNSDNSPGKQMSNVHTAITRGVDAIVIGPVSSISMTPILRLLHQHNMPIAFAGIGPPAGATKFTSAVTANNLATGKAEGHFVCKLAKERGGKKVGVLSLPLDRENAKKYLKGAKQSFKKDGCDLVQVIQTHGLTVREAVSEANDLLTAHPGIKAIYGMYDEAGTGAAKALQTRGLTGKIGIATADGSPTTIALLHKGELQGIFLQQAVGQGRLATQQLYNALNSKKVKKHIPLKEPLVTEKTVSSSEAKKVLKLVYPPSAGSY